MLLLHTNSINKTKHHFSVGGGGQGSPNFFSLKTALSLKKQNLS